MSGSWAVCERPLALRTRLATGVLFSRPRRPTDAPCNLGVYRSSTRRALVGGPLVDTPRGGAVVHGLPRSGRGRTPLARGIYAPSARSKRVESQLPDERIGRDSTARAEPAQTPAPPWGRRPVQRVARECSSSSRAQAKRGSGGALACPRSGRVPKPPVVASSTIPGLFVLWSPHASRCARHGLGWAASKMCRQVGLILPPSFGHGRRCLRGCVPW